MRIQEQLAFLLTCHQRPPPPTPPPAPGGRMPREREFLGEAMKAAALSAGGSMAAPTPPPPRCVRTAPSSGLIMGDGVSVFT